MNDPLKADGESGGETGKASGEETGENISAAEGNMTQRFFRETGPARDFAELVEPVVEDLGFRLVRITVSNRDGATVQIMVEHPARMITIADCTKISRELSPLLDAEDPISGSYHLEVSTPGIDRPLVRPQDFIDWAGYETRLMLTQAVEGRKRFRGMLEGFEDGEVRLSVKLDGWDKAQVLGFPVGLLEQAKLMMTDELIKAALAGKKNAKKAP